jgi:hypothetical protein
LDPNKFLLEKLPCFWFAKNVLVFIPIKNRVFFFFCYCFWFSFSPWFTFRSSYIYLSRCIFCLWTMLVFLKRVGLKKFEWCWKREKALLQKSGTRRSLCRLRLRLFHVVLDVFLIVCLVVLL